MNIQVTGKGIDVTEAIRQHAHEKVSKLTRYFDAVHSIAVLIDKVDNHKTEEVEIIVKADNTNPFIIRTQGPDLYACIDDACHKMERQLADHKDRVRDHKH